jgi:HK97 family phage major capsid protein
MVRLAELRGQRNVLAKQMGDLNDLATKEDRAFTADEDSNWAKMEGEIDKIDAEIRRLEKLGRIGTAEPSPLRAGGDEQRTGNDDDGQSSDAEYRTAFRSFLRHGNDGLDAEQRALMGQHRGTLTDRQVRNLTEREQRAFAAATGNAGGFTVPQDFFNQLEVAMRAFGGMMEVSDVIRTDTGATLPMPTFNRVAAKATIVGEGAGSTLDATTPFGQVNMGAFTYRTNMLPISYEFLQDGAFGEGYIIDALARDVAWAINEHATIGTGTGQPRGITLDAVSGKVGTTGQTVTVIYDDLVDLEHSVDPVYRRNAAFMMHDNSVRQIRKIKDSTGRPIWLPGYESGIGVRQPDTLMGYRYAVNQDMPQMAANAKSILFGDFKKYKIRMARDVTMLRLVERYADLLSVAFIMFARADARLLDAGTNPVKFYQNSAT